MLLHLTTFIMQNGTGFYSDSHIKLLGMISSVVGLDAHFFMSDMQVYVDLSFFARCAKHPG